MESSGVLIMYIYDLWLQCFVCSIFFGIGCLVWCLVVMYVGQSHLTLRSPRLGNRKFFYLVAVSLFCSYCGHLTIGAGCFAAVCLCICILKFHIFQLFLFEPGDCWSSFHCFHMFPLSKVIGRLWWMTEALGELLISKLLFKYLIICHDL